jgi:hypothetical protein
MDCREDDMRLRIARNRPRLRDPVEAHRELDGRELAFASEEMEFGDDNREPSSA